MGSCSPTKAAIPSNEKPESTHDLETPNGDFRYVRKKILETLTDKLEKHEEVTEKLVEELLLEKTDDKDELLVPMLILSEWQPWDIEFGDAEQMIKKLGPKNAAEEYAKAVKYCDARAKKDKPISMTIAKWENIRYVRKDILQTLKKNEPVTEKLVFELNSYNVQAQEVMLPANLKVQEENIDKLTDEQAVEPRLLANTWIKAAEFFEAKPEEERPRPMTAANWKAMLDAKAATARKKQREDDEKWFLKELKKTDVKSRELLKNSPDSVKDNLRCVLAAVEKDGNALEFAASHFKASQDVVLAAVTNKANAIQHVDKKASIWNSKEFVRSIVKERGAALKFASNTLKGEQDVVLTAFCGLKFDVTDYMSVKDMVKAAVTKNGKALDYATEGLKADRDVVLPALRQMNFPVEDNMSVKEMMMAAVKKDGKVLEYADPRLKADKEVVLAAIGQSCNSWIFASDSMKEDKDVLFPAFKQQGVAVHQNMTPKDLMLEKCKVQGFSMQYAPESFKSDKGFVLQMVNIFGETLEFAKREFKADKEVVLAAVTNRSKAFEFVDKKANMWSDKSFVLPMVQWDGNTLQYADGTLREDMEVVIAAVKQNGSALKFALGVLNQCHGCLLAAGLWDSQYDSSLPFEVTQSVKFSLAERSTTYATDFTLAMKKDQFLKQFKTYNPNAWRKSSCDPEFTCITHRCRGTRNSLGGSDKCEFDDNRNLDNQQKPRKKSCWRFAFRFHLDQCKEANGFMIQVQEIAGLGGGQQIETEMARNIGLKVFRTYSNYADFSHDRIDKLSDAIQAWQRSAPADLNLQPVYIGKDSRSPAYDGQPN